MGASRCYLNGSTVLTNPRLGTGKGRLKIEGRPFAEKLEAFCCSSTPSGFRHGGGLDRWRVALSDPGSRRFPTRGSLENADVARLSGEFLAQEFLGLGYLGVPRRELLGCQEIH